MGKKCNPIGRRGDRNVFCSNYNDCLDTAITRSWNTWNCCHCPLRFNQTVGKQNLSISTDSIAEYGLMVQSIGLDWGLPDFEFDGEFDAMALY